MSGVTNKPPLKPKTKGLFARMTVEPLDGDRYTREQAQRECTNCRYRLPYNIEKVPAITLAVVGDTFSGKSHFIAAFVQQLQTEWLGNTGGFASIECLTPEVEKEYAQKYFQQLFVNKMKLAPTDPNEAKIKAKAPLIYQLTITPSPRHPPISVNLMIYDVAGEIFETKANIVQFAPFLLKTTALIFVVDPFTIPSVFPRLAGPLQTLLQPSFSFANAQGRRAVQSIDTSISVFERYHGQSRGANLAGIPVAVMLSKADLFRKFDPPLPNPPTFLSNPQYEDELDLDDIKMVNDEVQMLLKSFGQNDLLAATRRLRDVNFFATSASGKPPDSSGRFASVDPFRCLDPILWILYKLRVIKGYHR